MTETGRKGMKRAFKYAAFFAAYVSAFLLIWIFAVSAVKNEYILPPIKKVFQSVLDLLGQKGFYTAFFATLKRAVNAFLISFFAAFIFAVAAYLLPLFYRIFAPVVSGLRSLPTMAIMLVLLVWSTPKKAPVIVAFLALFPMLYTGIFAALSTVDKKLLDVCKTYKVPVYKRIFSMYVPIALPYTLREAAAGLSFSLKLIVSAEVLANTYLSLGGMLQESKIWLRVSETFALTLIVIVVGLLLEGLGLLLARYAERRTK